MNHKQCYLFTHLCMVPECQTKCILIDSFLLLGIFERGNRDFWPVTVSLKYCKQAASVQRRISHCKHAATVKSCSLRTSREQERKERYPVDLDCKLLGTMSYYQLWSTSPSKSALRTWKSFDILVTMRQQFVRFWDSFMVIIHLQDTWNLLRPPIKKAAWVLQSLDLSYVPETTFSYRMPLKLFV